MKRQTKVTKVKRQLRPMVKEWLIDVFKGACPNKDVYIL